MSLENSENIYFIQYSLTNYWLLLFHDNFDLYLWEDK